MTIVQHNFHGKTIFQTSEDTVIGNVSVPKGYTNLTAICQANKKKLSHYLELKATKEYIVALETDLLENEKMTASPMVITIQGCFDGDSSLQGAWGHPDIVIDLAKWISTDFRIWANRVLRRVLNNEFEALTEEAKEAQKEYQKQWDSLRDQTITTRKSLTKAIQEWYTNNPGGTSRPLHAMISTVTNLVYQKLWGMDAKQLEDYLGCGRHEARDYLDPQSLRILERAEDNLIEFICEDNLKPVDAVPLANIRLKPLPTRHEPIEN